MIRISRGKSWGGVRDISVIIAAVSIFLFFPSAAAACSISSSTYFEEVARSFTVAVRFEAKPLAAANVTLLAFDTVKPVSSAMTASEGTVRFTDIRPGKYYLDIGYLGISAAFAQIEIRARVSAQAKSTLDYRWGDAPTAVRQIAGKIVDMRPQGATPLEKIVNPRVEVPIRSAQIQVQHPVIGSAFTGESDDKGEFALVGVPDGIYVMHVRGGVSPDDSAKFLVQVAQTATKQSLQLVRGELCGGTAIQLQPY
jgi:hypothetical protein